MPGMSCRDQAIALGMSRQELARARALASLPKDEFEAYIADCRSRKEPASSRALELLARRRANKSTEYERRCPHCGYLLRIEDAG